jgi:hypothetical protein
MGGRSQEPPITGTTAPPRPSEVQRRYLERGLNQPGGKLPLFDGQGRGISPKTVEACIAHGWAEPWFANPLKPGWLVCKLTAEGFRILGVASIDDGRQSG